MEMQAIFVCDMKIEITDFVGRREYLSIINILVFILCTLMRDFN